MGDTLKSSSRIQNIGPLPGAHHGRRVVLGLGVETSPAARLGCEFSDRFCSCWIVKGVPIEVDKDGSKSR